LAQLLCSCAESAANTKHSRNKQFDAVQAGAASLLVLGIAIATWAYLGLRPQSPPQDASVVISTPKPSASAGNTPAPKPSSSEKFAVPTYLRRPAMGSKIGTLTLPSLKLSWPVYEGTSNAQLSKGVGHYRGSVLPGISDNTVFSGHRMTVFNRLGELHTRDTILVRTSAGVFTYRVRSFRVVKKTDRTVIVPTKTSVLTLTTCYPFNNIGATSHVFVVTAALVSENLTQAKK
jgi:sortase A